MMPSHEFPQDPEAEPQVINPPTDPEPNQPEPTTDLDKHIVTLKPDEKDTAELAMGPELKTREELIASWEECFRQHFDAIPAEELSESLNQQLKQCQIRTITPLKGKSKIEICFTNYSSSEDFSNILIINPFSGDIRREYDSWSRERTLPAASGRNLWNISKNYVAESNIPLVRPVSLDIPQKPRRTIDNYDIRLPPIRDNYLLVSYSFSDYRSGFLGKLRDIVENPHSDLAYHGTSHCLSKIVPEDLIPKTVEKPIEMDSEMRATELKYWQAYLRCIAGTLADGFRNNPENFNNLAIHYKNQLDQTASYFPENNPGLANSAEALIMVIGLYLKKDESRRQLAREKDQLLRANTGEAENTNELLRAAEEGETPSDQLLRPTDEPSEPSDES